MRNLKFLPLCLKVLVSALLIWFLLSGLDLSAVQTRIFSISPTTLILVLLILFLQIVLISLRWNAVLTAIDNPLPFKNALEYSYIGLFFGQALPSTIGGDAVREYKAYWAGHSLRKSVNSVLIDRVLGATTLVLMITTGGWFFISRVPPEETEWITLFIALLGILCLAGLAVLMMLDKLPAMLYRWRFIRGLEYLVIDIRSIFHIRKNIFSLLAFALLGHANTALCLYVLALDMGLMIKFVDCIFLMPVVMLISALPVSIAGWGIREEMMIVALGLAGISAEDAFAASVLFGLALMASSLPGGLVWLLSKNSKQVATQTVKGM